MTTRYLGLWRTDSEGGFSLAEVLVTIVIVSVAFTAILGGLMTSISVSSLHRKEATADTIARDAAESLKDVGLTYKPCAAPTGLNSYSIPAAPSGYAVSVMEVRYWDGTPGTPLLNPFLPNGSACPNPDKGLQLITVVATSTGSAGGASETVQVVKRSR